MKKVRVKKKNYLVLILFILVVIFLIFLLVESISGSRSNYKKVSHVSSVEKSIKRNDTKDYKTTGWLDVYGTTLDMPIFKVNNDFESEKLESFSWSDSTKFSNLITIYGHNIMNLGVPRKKDESFKRFDELMNYVYPDYLERHEYFQITMNDKDYVYKIFSVSILGTYDLHSLPVNGASKKETNDLLKMLNDENIYKTRIKVNNSDDIVILTTCTRMIDDSTGYSIAVSGVRVKDGESKKKYTINKSSKYSKIDKILRGDKK